MRFIATHWDSKSFLGISSLRSGIPISFWNSFILGLRVGNTFNPMYPYSQHKIAEIKVTYSSKVKFSEMTKIESSQDAHDLLRSVWSDTMELREEFYILLLNRASKALGYYCLSVGGTTTSIVDAKLVFSTALKCNAQSIILAHNHPSGNLQPSDSDIGLTKKLREGGKLLDIEVLDHIILTKERYLSFADEGMII